jgi:hypothetical protein
MLQRGMRRLAERSKCGLSEARTNRRPTPHCLCIQHAARGARSNTAGLIHEITVKDPGHYADADAIGELPPRLRIRHDHGHKLAHDQRFTKFPQYLPRAAYLPELVASCGYHWKFSDCLTKRHWRGASRRPVPITRCRGDRASAGRPKGRSGSMCGVRCARLAQEPLSGCFAQLSVRRRSVAPTA